MVDLKWVKLSVTDIQWSRFLERSDWLLAMEKKEGATWGVLSEKVFLEISQSSQENTCARVSFLMKLQAACEFCEISKNIFFTEPLYKTASEKKN